MVRINCNWSKQTLGEAGASESERAIGLSFDKTAEEVKDGTTYGIGSCLDSNGNATLRIVECDGTIHWPTGHMTTDGALTGRRGSPPRGILAALPRCSVR